MGLLVVRCQFPLTGTDHFTVILTVVQTEEGTYRSLVCFSRICDCGKLRGAVREV